ncbi:acyl transferase 5 [Macadamia integrifolia]|uniref:acyl transferase 5 n=1 Tax=Macadamia integrifolia TaxID=60698 RepID=UPI001C53127F|nr:acyl transferase 5 [Macadamia integrifolia]
MTLSVTRTARGMVQPSGQTPTGTLHLSFIDRLPVLRCNARTLHVFRHGHEPAEIIREALSKALVPYYPLAGRLKESSQGELQIACTGEGLWFVQASADCSMDAVNYFDNIPMVHHEKLLPDLLTEVDDLDPLVLMQVTQFTCGGFVMGLIFCHSICDGLGAAQFLSAVGELARGLHHPSVAPVWCREALATTAPQVYATGKANPPPPLPFLPDYQLKHATMDITPDQINQLKHEFQESTGQTCSTFEIVAARMWSRRTKAINLEKDAKVTLVIFANARQLLHPPLPKGFYGNCFFPVTITVSSEKVSQASHAEVVKLIQESKSMLPIEFTKWINGNSVGDVDPFAPPLAYTTMFISEWGRLGFNQVDYGWGPPVHMIPIQGSSIIPVAIVGTPPKPKKGIRLMTWSVSGPHLQNFLEQMLNLT